MTLNVDNDYLIFDNTESVTVTRERTDGDDSVTVDNALRRAISRAELSAAGVRITGRELVWNIPKTQLGDGDIAEGDTITDTEGVVFHVKSLQFGTWESRVRAICQRDRGC